MMATAPAAEVAAAARRGDTVIDVRTAEEYASGHVPGSVFMPLHVVPLRLSEFSRRTPVYVVCESGARAFQACQYLEQHGYQTVNMHGGMTAYRSSGLPVERSRSARV